ncbi:MAG: insulinase family protein, partial [Bacteroidales bacterium]|nr:insulinase family protein [Bacteroidales bacterium]
MKHRSQFFLLMLTGILLISGCQPKTQDLNLMYEKYTLANGLEVVLHPDHSDPIVAVAIQYHVGSNREEPGKTGFAHFFEHMLFQASEHLGRDEFFSKIENLGGEFNGGTWQDGTVYYEVVPNDALEKILWMEPDRMGFFINQVSETGLKREIDVVVNEKRQTQDNRAYGYTNDVVLKNLYPKGHPYSWTVIGEMADLKGATIEDVKKFYNTYYGTNNATLVIAGDYDTEEVKKLVEKYFGEIKPKEEVTPLKPMNPVLSETKNLYHEDQFANMPELSIVFPSVEMFHPDSYALDLLTTLLSDGKKAPLYKVLVEEKKLAPSVAMFNNSQELGGYSAVRVRAFDTVDLDNVYAAVQEAFKKFEETGVDEKELQAIKNMAETSFYQSMASILDKSFQIAQANIFAGTPDQIMKDIESIRKVSAEDLMRVYNTYIKGKNHLTTSFVPMGKTNLTIEGAVKANVIIEDASQQDFEANGEKIVDATYEMTPSAFDRTQEPPLGKELTLTSPKIWTDTLSNGIKIYGIEQDELPLVHFTLTLTGGPLFDTPEKAGVALLTTQLMNEGSENKTPEEMEEALKLLGASVNIYLDGEKVAISGYCMTNTYEQVMNLVEELLLHPRWDAKEFDRLKQALLSGIQQEMVNPGNIASRVFLGLIYGKESILGQSQRGTQASVSAITLDDLKAYYQNYFSPNLATFHVAGE